MNRREVLRLSGIVTASAFIGAPLSHDVHAADQRHETWKIVVAGGHPDDPESGCGGTMRRYSAAGHEVVALYLTRGEAGIPGTPHDEAARIRTAEAERACDILGARPIFAGQIDGSTEVTPPWYEKVYEILAQEQPDLIFTHWPVDTHRDHRAISLLVYDAWLRLEPRPALYYFEVLTGDQTQTFRPTHYVDISSVEERKRAAIYAHASQDPADWYPAHAQMSRFRGSEYGCEHAEAFIHHERSPYVPLIQ